MQIAMGSNRLAAETSPYLLQHAHNPVDWHPWGQEALSKARRENKPILLSIGYSACHWCHVMAHESFEDATTAELMNRLFINIKVDREERPDLDKVYQAAHQLLTRRPGGWPLTMLLTPDDQTPFFAGTYFPPEPRHGMPAFRDLLQRAAGYFHAHEPEIRRQNGALTTALHTLYAAGQGTKAIAGPQVFEQARLLLLQQFDREDGGFGQAPKFPHTDSIVHLLRCWSASNNNPQQDRRGLEMALFTLEKMARGGMYDQLGGGFCRYSTDDAWMIPHFEKMLYDNGLLLSVYADASAITGRPLFHQTVRDTADWLMREMQSPEGGYYSSYDADSEGEEGRFYVWDRNAVREILTAEEYAVLAHQFGLNRPPNFEGQWHLHGYLTLEETAGRLQWDAEDARMLLLSACRKLKQARDERVWPGRDDKILTAWNALAIKGMANAAYHLREPRYADSATRALDFIRQTLWRDGRLLATYKDGKAHLMAYLDDYAYLLDAILTLLQVRWNTSELRFAQDLADVLLEWFEDREQGGFWFVAHDHESLVQRPKTWTDEAIPAGNGVAAHALQRLGYLLGETRYLDAVERCLKAASFAIERMPSAHAAVLRALDEYLNPPETWIVRCVDALDAGWHSYLAGYAPRRQIFVIPADEADLPTALAAKASTGNTVLYRCKGMTCEAPLRTLP